MSVLVQDLADASFFTNPLLWWLAILAHSDVYRFHPGLPIPDLEDSLNLTAKRDALDHCSRVLVFHDTFINWTTPPIPSSRSRGGNTKSLLG